MSLGPSVISFSRPASAWALAKEAEGDTHGIHTWVPHALHISAESGFGLSKTAAVLRH